MIYLACLEEERTALPPFPEGAVPEIWPVDGETDLPPEEARLVCYLPEEAARKLLPLAAERRWTLAFLPHRETGHLMAAYGISDRPEEAWADAMEKPGTPVDLLLCNDLPVYSTVLIGEVAFLEEAPEQRKNGPLERGRRFFRSLKAMVQRGLRPLNLITAKGYELQTAAFGALAVEHSRSRLLSRPLREISSFDDGKLTFFILAPKSLLSLAHLGFRLLFTPGFLEKGLPPSVGLVKAKELTVSRGGQPINFVVDGQTLAAKELVFKVLPRYLTIVPGRHMESSGPAEADDKETVKVSGLPKGEERNQLAGNPLPLIPHGSEENFKELFLSLREAAKPSASFLTLMVLSTLLATVGLFADSASVVIGAMILAPLMAPIVSAAMGFARQDSALLFRSLGSTGLGVGLAMGFAALFTLMVPLESLTGEIRARLHPNLLDLGVAILSGIAGAYANAKEEVAKSLAGVAIAVALVPPLAVTGIGLGLGRWEVMGGAFLLFATNMVGIILAAGLTFVVLGFASIRSAGRGLALSFLATAALAVPLGIGFADRVERSGIEHRLENRTLELGTGTLRLSRIEVIQSDPLRIGLRLAASHTLSEEELVRFREAVTGLLEREATLEIIQVVVR